MAKEIIFTPIAAADFDGVVEYLLIEWGISVADAFVGRFEKLLILLSNNAAVFPFFDSVKQIQKCVVTKHNILYFRETDDVIKILTVFDTRQNPEKLFYII